MITCDIKDGAVSVRPIVFSGELLERTALTHFSLAQMGLTTQMSLSTTATFNKRTTYIYSQIFFKK